MQEEYVTKAEISKDAKSWLFRAAQQERPRLTDRPMCRQDVQDMIRRRAVAAGIKTKSAATRSELQGSLPRGLTPRTAGGGEVFELSQAIANDWQAFSRTIEKKPWPQRPRGS
jgi:hypothetical protein